MIIGMIVFDRPGHQFNAPNPSVLLLRRLNT
jgi:hypothetical protein